MRVIAAKHIFSVFNYLEHTTFSYYFNVWFYIISQLPRQIILFMYEFYEVRDDW